MCTHGLVQPPGTECSIFRQNWQQANFKNGLKDKKILSTIVSALKNKIEILHNEKVLPSLITCNYESKL